MYVWIWRHLPGPVSVRVAACVLLALAAAALLLFAVFPWLDPYLPFDEITVR